MHLILSRLKLQKKPNNPPIIFDIWAIPCHERSTFKVTRMWAFGVIVVLEKMAREEIYSE